MNKNLLPEVKNKKKINVKEFEVLAKKVKKSFDEEMEYLKKRNENNPPRGVLLQS